jgi:hypothetical protein
MSDRTDDQNESAAAPFGGAMVRRRDAEYFDDFAELCRVAGDYGFYLFVDLHQNVWSRMPVAMAPPAGYSRKSELTIAD